MVSRKQISMVWSGTLSKGINHIEVRAFVLTPTTVSGTDWKHVYVDARSAFFDVALV